MADHVAKSGAEEGKYLEVKLNRVMAEVNRHALRRAHLSVEELDNAAQDVLGQDGSGRVYGKHRASAPGEAPAPNSGNLRTKWRKYIIGAPTTKGMRVTIRIKSDMPYAGILEKGSANMAPRPYKQRIIDAATPEIQKIYGEAILS